MSGGHIPGVTQPLGTHTDTEGHAVTVNVAGHPPRTDSPEYVKSRALMNRLAGEMGVNPYGSGSVEDHHGGGWWLKDGQGWFVVKAPWGCEWSAQFCADPAKFDALRIIAGRLYAAFPEAIVDLGISAILENPITDSAGVATWVDSILNASLPLPKAVHTGTVSAASPHAGVHGYPTPITDIQFLKRDDFNLFVTVTGGTAAVVPVAPRGSGDGRVQVLHASAGTRMRHTLQTAQAQGEPLILAPTHKVASQAFAKQ